MLAKPSDLYFSILRTSKNRFHIKVTLAIVVLLVKIMKFRLLWELSLIPFPSLRPNGRKDHEVIN